MRIFHGTTEIAGQMGILSGELKRQGHISVGYNTFHSYLGYQDHLINTNRKVISRMAEHLMRFFDIFHFHYGRTILRENKDLDILKQLQKKMVMHHWGNDVRFHGQARINNPYVYTGDSPPDERIAERLLRISQYIREAIVQDHEVLPYVAPYYEKVHIVPIAINLEHFIPHYPSEDTEQPLIVHAPTNPLFKGTKPIEQAIEQLKNEFKFDYVRIQHLNHEEAVKRYKQADIIVDQILCGSYGLLSTEAMALGKPVVAYIRHDLANTFPASLPIVNANPDTIYEQLKRLLQAPKLRLQLGKRGRAYVQKTHAKEVVVKKLIKIYEQLQV